MKGGEKKRKVMFACAQGTCKFTLNVGVKYEKEVTVSFQCLGSNINHHLNINLVSPQCHIMDIKYINVQQLRDPIRIRMFPCDWEKEQETPRLRIQRLVSDRVTLT